VTPKQAGRQIDVTDQERNRFTRDHFHKDPTDPRGYDLVLNSSRFSVAECATLIIEGLHQLQARTMS
jgi:cytidylate kinase